MTAPAQSRERSYRFAPATLHKQGKQPDAMDGQDKKDRDFYAGPAFVFLLQEGTLWDKWTLNIHFYRRWCAFSYWGVLVYGFWFRMR